MRWAIGERQKDGARNGSWIAATYHELAAWAATALVAGAEALFRRKKPPTASSCGPEIEVNEAIFR